MANSSPPIPGQTVVDRDFVTPPILSAGVEQCYRRTAVPAIVAQGTVATNGVVTLLTSLGITPQNAWLWLPAGAVVGGAAGWYFTKFLTPTTAQVHTDYVSTAGGFVPFVPKKALFPVVGSNVAYTVPLNTDILLASVTVPGGVMGDNGCFDLQFEVNTLNNANTKTLKVNIGATTVYNSTSFLTSQTASRAVMRVSNRGIQTEQRVSSPAVGIGATGNRFLLNMAADQAVSVLCQISVATDFVMLDAFSMTISSEP